MPDHGHDDRRDPYCRNARDNGQDASCRPDRFGLERTGGPGRNGSRGHYACPDHNRRTWDPDITCAACKRCGHPASNCDMLAMALFLDKYVKGTMSHSDQDKIETAWLQRWKDKLGNLSRLLCKIMKAYLDYMDISMEVLDEQMDWDCWPVDDEMEDFGIDISQESPAAL
jgi:hypothetical protein